MNFINVVGFVLTQSVYQPEELKLSQVRKCNQLIADCYYKFALGNHDSFAL